MAISLTKGGNVNLSKEAPTMQKAVVGLGWDARATDGSAFDLDASAFMLNPSDKVRSDDDFIFYNQPKSVEGSLEHLGDNRTGTGEGDDEQIIVDLDRVPSGVQHLVFTVNSFSGQSFDQVQRAFCRLLDGSNQREIARYDLGCQGPHTALVMAKLYRHNDVWKMHAIGEKGRGRTFQELLPILSQHL